MQNKKKPAPGWLRNTGSNVSNVVPSQETDAGLAGVHGNNNHYHSRL